jgi:hypothetical protein
MKSLTEQLWFEVPGRRGFVNITETVAGLVRQSGVQEGLCLVNAMHITASVFINDAEEELPLYRSTRRQKRLAGVRMTLDRWRIRDFTNGDEAGGGPFMRSIRRFGVRPKAARMASAPNLNSGWEL